MRVLFKAFMSALALAGLGVTLLACGQSRERNPITVGTQEVSHADIAGFASAIKRGSTFAWMSPELSTYDKQASALLIRYRWLIGEAAAQGVAVSGKTAAGVLHSRASSSVGGDAAYKASLGETGETQAQAQLAVLAELSAQNLRRKIASSTPQPTRAQIASYYRSHLASFQVSEVRLFNLAERIDGPTELASARRAMLAGHTISGLPYEAEFNESLPRSLVAKPVRSSPDVDRQVVVNAIFSTPPGVVAGPFKYYGKKAIFKVDRIVPGYVRPLSQVSGQIAKRLRDRALASARQRFIAAWRSKWTARTECASGYVVYGCKEYHGRAAAEEDPLSPE